jgi:triphosphatase
MARKFALIDASVTPAKYKAMAQEIELKFIVEKDSVDALRQHLHTLSGEHHEPVQLLNIYYETPDNWLRRHDMGLRIRGASGRYEMTMKIAGRVVGGLHQRPEYNIDISKPELELERFPAEVWPEGELPERWQAGAAAVQHRFLAREMAGDGR